MNARSYAIDPRDVSNSMMRRLLAGMLLAFLLLNATIAIAGAESRVEWKYKGTQNQFTGDCRRGSNQPHREATHAVSCTRNDGAKTVCDFNTKPASCVTTIPARPASTTDSDFPDQEIQAEDTGVVNPSDLSDTDVVFEEVSTGQADPASAPDVVLEETVAPDPPVIESDGSVISVIPTDVEEIPMFGQ